MSEHLIEKLHANTILICYQCLDNVVILDRLIEDARDSNFPSEDDSPALCATFVLCCLCISKIPAFLPYTDSIPDPPPPRYRDIYREPYYNLLKNSAKVLKCDDVALWIPSKSYRVSSILDLTDFKQKVMTISENKLIEAKSDFIRLVSPYTDG